MAAGLGFKTFAVGEILSAANVNGYLMQGVLVFANATARDAAITSPQEGQFAYLKDTNVTTYYTGSAWANLDTTGMTNPMTTTGDTIYSSSGSTPARLGIGSTGDVLTVAGGIPSWAAPAGGGKVLQVVQATSTTSTNVTSTTTYGDLGLSVSITPSSATSKVLVLISQSLYSYRGSNNTGYAIRLVRDSTAVWTPSVGNYQSGYVFLSGASSSGTNAQMYNTFNLHYLDSPATTSATTYKTQGLCSGGNVNAQEGGNGSTIIVMEIAA